VHRETAKWVGSALACAICATVALLISLRQAESNGTAPSSASSAWRWIGARPGLNVYYVARRSSRDGVTSVWVDRRFYASAVSVNKDILELWDVDCPGQRIRPAVGSQPRWDHAPTATPAGGLLRSVCADIDRHDPN
jgi:hypothetical protein